jgi:L-serine deaminase
MSAELQSRPELAHQDPLMILDWVNLYALAVNEENAAGGRVVTAPTNGAAGGLVQIPCIERNAMGSVKAINAQRIAMRGDGRHRVSLDKVIRTMRVTGRDMQDKYKETSRGGLAVNVIEC